MTAVRILYILLAILFFGIMVAIHEFGHFFTAKLLGVKVNEFAIGMGPTIWARKKGDTQYSLRAFPVGGFCAMEGEDEDTGDPNAFSAQKWWKKLVILAAGSIMNFFLGLLIVLILYSGLTAVIEPVITEFMDGFPLSGESGLMEGDRILSIDGHPILMYSDIHMFLARNDGNGMDLVVERNGEKLILDALPISPREYEYKGKESLLYGFVFGEVKELDIWGRVELGVAQTLDFVRMVWLSLSDLISGKVGVGEMSGVIGIVDTVGDLGVASETVVDGLLNVLYLVAFISVNLAVMNLLPIPALDGGRIFFLAINGCVFLLFRRYIPEKYEGYVHTAGFLLLIALMILVAFNDVWKIIFS